VNAVVQETLVFPCYICIYIYIYIYIYKDSEHQNKIIYIYRYVGLCRTYKEKQPYCDVLYYKCAVDLRSPKTGCFSTENWSMGYNLIELKQNTSHYTNCTEVSSFSRPTDVTGLAMSNVWRCIGIVWDVMPCSLVQFIHVSQECTASMLTVEDWTKQGTVNCLVGSTFFRSVRETVPDCTASHCRRTFRMLQHSIDRESQVSTSCILSRGNFTLGSLLLCFQHWPWRGDVGVGQRDIP
jgi:hypothetical protein